MIAVEALKSIAGNFKISVDLQVGQNDYMVILGQSGSGKTLLLECICGLRNITSGTIKINDTDITSWDPRNRNISYVPQEGALFEHLTVEDNLAFGLKVTGADKRQVRKVIDGLAELLSISYMKKRKIKGLSGGERQRVALGRAMAVSPFAMLFDEPVSALDEKTREEICSELVLLQRKLSIPVIHVCHSVDEAASVSTKVAIMQNGRIIQCGTLEEIQMRPVNRYVAGLLRLENIYEGENSSSGSVFSCKKLWFRGERVPSRKFAFVIKPWDFKMADADDLVNRIEGTITEIRFAGPVIRITIGGDVVVKMALSRREFNPDIHKKGGHAAVTFSPDALWVLPDCAPVLSA